MRTRILIPAFALAAVLSGVVVSVAHDPGALTPDIQIKVDGADNLVADYPFAGTPVIRVFDTGFAGLFAEDDPGFLPGEVDSPPSGLTPPALGTEVGIEVLALDSNVRLRVGGDTLDAPFATAVLGTHDDDLDLTQSGLHTHGEWQLIHDESAARRFAEGSISFRLYDTAGTFGPTGSHTLTLSNGYLPGVTAPDKDTVKCTKAVGKEMGKLFLSTHSTFAKCLTAADSYLAAGRGDSKVLKACSIDESDERGAVGKILAARAKALSKIDRACGPLDGTSTPYTLGAVEAHLDMARCRAEELIGATYNNSRDVITAAIEGVLFGSACVANTCGGGLADGLACTTDDDCATKTLVTQATVCMAESAIPE